MAETVLVKTDEKVGKTMFLYPKIETLFDRDSKFKVDESKIRLPEFSNVKNWFVTEKIDGTCIRGFYEKGYSQVQIGGRTNKAEIPKFLQQYLHETFTLEKMEKTFEDLPRATLVKLFVEAYGPKIQKGNNYRNDVACRLFDVVVGEWWLEPGNITDIACKLGIKTVPKIGIMSLEEAVQYVKSKPHSIVAQEDGGNPEFPMEGIVARSYPLMLRRNKERVIFKLKVSDFANI